MANYKISQLTAYPNSTFGANDRFEVSYYTGGIYYSRYLTGTQLKATIVTQTITNGVTTTAPSEDAVFDALALKQATLVSATNIKTINGNSLLGSGNITISGGGGVGSSLYLYNNFI